MSHPRLQVPRRLYADIYVASDRPIGASLIGYEHKRVDARPALKAENCNVPVVVMDAADYDALMDNLSRARASYMVGNSTTELAIDHFLNNQPKPL